MVFSRARSGRPVGQNCARASGRPDFMSENLSVRGITVTAGGNALVRDVSFDLAPGEFIALIGPNGAGKTTLLRAALGLLKPTRGQALLGGRDIRRLAPLERARRVSYLPQTRPLVWPQAVRDVVALGRFAYGVVLGRLSGPDAAAVDAALGVCDLVHLKDRSAATLSGGERARMHCARALAAEAPLLVADEPVASLDPRHQFEVMGLIRDFVNRGGGALIVLHDVGLARRFADRFLWMKDGEIVADGSAAETLAPERMESVFGVRARVEGERVAIEGPV